jgi:hypothetical protein
VKARLHRGRAMIQKKLARVLGPEPVKEEA